MACHRDVDRNSQHDDQEQQPAQRLARVDARQPGRRLPPLFPRSGLAPGRRWRQPRSRCRKSPGAPFYRRWRRPGGQCLPGYRRSRLRCTVFRRGTRGWSCLPLPHARLLFRVGGGARGGNALPRPLSLGQGVEKQIQDLIGIRRFLSGPPQGILSSFCHDSLLPAIAPQRIQGSRRCC